MRARTVVERLAVCRIELEHTPENGVCLFRSTVPRIPLGQTAENDDIVHVLLELAARDLDDLQRCLVRRVDLAELEVHSGEISPRVIVLRAELGGSTKPVQGRL